MFKKDKSLQMSAPKTTLLYGVKICKLPIARYIKVLAAIDELPSVLIGTAFPDMELSEVFKALKSLTKDDLPQLLGRLLTKAPTEFCKLISPLLDIPEERFLDAEAADALSLSELAEIFLAFWEANDMAAFFENVRRLKQRANAQNTGSNES